MPADRQARRRDIVETFHQVVAGDQQDGADSIVIAAGNIQRVVAALDAVFAKMKGA